MVDWYQEGWHGTEGFPLVAKVGTGQLSWNQSVQGLAQVIFSMRIATGRASPVTAKKILFAITVEGGLRK